MFSGLFSPTFCIKKIDGLQFFPVKEIFMGPFYSYLAENYFGPVLRAGWMMKITLNFYYFFSTIFQLMTCGTALPTCLKRWERTRSSESRKEENFSTVSVATWKLVLFLNWNSTGTGNIQFSVCFDKKTKNR
jgi:hypothetical protein